MSTESSPNRSDSQYYNTVGKFLEWTDLGEFRFLENNPIRTAMYRGYVITEFRKEVSVYIITDSYYHDTFDSLSDALSYIDNWEPRGAVLR